MKLKILDIRDAWDPVWGNVVSVIANDVRKMESSLAFVPYVNADSKYFIFPNWEEITFPLEDIAKSNRVWTPSEDFTIDTRKTDNGKILTMYFHSTLYDNVGTRTDDVSYDVTLNRGLLSSIKDFDSKVSEMWKKYITETGGEEWIRSFVEEKPRAELLQWLFGIEYLNDEDTVTCGLRRDEFERFIDRLEELEEENEYLTRL